MSAESASDEFHHWAFVCHSSKDERWREWLLKHISLFRTPGSFVGKPTADGEIPRRIGPILARSDNGDANESISDKTREELQRSRYLIVVCSPAGALSTHVDECVRHFKSIGREHRVLCLIVAGEPYASSRLDPIGEECLPRSVKYEVSPAGEITDTPTAPFAADARPGKDGRRTAFLKLAAGLLRLDFGELKQREHDRGQIRMTLTLAGALILMIFFFLFATWSFQAAREAENAIDEARKAADFADSEFQKRQVTFDRQRALIANLNARLGEARAAEKKDPQALARYAEAIRRSPETFSHTEAAIATLARLKSPVPAAAQGEPPIIVPNLVLAAVSEAVAGQYVADNGGLAPLDEERIKLLRESTESQQLNERVKAWAEAAFNRAAPPKAGAP